MSGFRDRTALTITGLQDNYHRITWKDCYVKLVNTSPSGRMYAQTAKLKKNPQATKPTLARSELIAEEYKRNGGDYSARSISTGSIRTARITAGIAANAAARIVSDGSASIIGSPKSAWQ